MEWIRFCTLQLVEWIRLCALQLVEWIRFCALRLVEWIRFCAVQLVEWIRFCTLQLVEWIRFCTLQLVEWIRFCTLQLVEWIRFCALQVIRYYRLLPPSSHSTCLSCLLTAFHCRQHFTILFGLTHHTHTVSLESPHFYLLNNGCDVFCRKLFINEYFFNIFDNFLHINVTQIDLTDLTFIFMLVFMAKMLPFLSCFLNIVLTVITNTWSTVVQVGGRWLWHPCCAVFHNKEQFTISSSSLWHDYKMLFLVGMGLCLYRQHDLKWA